MSKSGLQVKATLATDAVVGAMTSPNNAGSAYVRMPVPVLFPCCSRAVAVAVAVTVPNLCRTCACAVPVLYPCCARAVPNLCRTCAEPVAVHCRCCAGAVPVLCACRFSFTT